MTTKLIRSRTLISVIVFLKILIVLVVLVSHSIAHPVIVEKPKSSFVIGPCTWVIDRKCPDDDIEFYLFTKQNPQDRQYIHIDETWEQSNLSTSFFNPYHPVKIIIHGYNSDMFLHPLVQMKDEYLQRGDYNLIYIDWSKLSTGPCYLSAVHNSKHVGACIAQLIERILEAGTANIHLIGFSLGAQVTNFVANSLETFFIPRITGLDPAMPLFIFVSNENKLDPSDAAFVDVIHTNALVQGKIERCGHVDFYMNGGIIQPGCFSSNENPFACSHHRAPDYYAESIRSFRGFWGWQCSSYINYLFGLCPPTNYLVLAGEDCNPETLGMYLITTNSEPPFAQGKWTDNRIYENNLPITPFDKMTLLSKEIDQWGKLNSNFNNDLHFPTPYFQDPIGVNYIYFGHNGTKEITNVIDENNLIIVNKDKKFDDTLSGNHVNKYNNQKLQKNPPKLTIHTPQNTSTRQNGQQRRKQFIKEYKMNLTRSVLNDNVLEMPAINLE